MNTYRVIFRIKNRRHRYDVDASQPQTAICRALSQFTNPSTRDVDVSCRLLASGIERNWGDPKVRAV